MNSANPTGISEITGRIGGVHRPKTITHRGLIISCKTKGKSQLWVKAKYTQPIYWTSNVVAFLWKLKGNVVAVWDISEGRKEHRVKRHLTWLVQIQSMCIPFDASRYLDVHCVHFSLFQTSQTAATVFLSFHKNTMTSDVQYISYVYFAFIHNCDCYEIGIFPLVLHETFNPLSVMVFGP